MLMKSVVNLIIFRLTTGVKEIHSSMLLSDSFFVFHKFWPQYLFQRVHYCCFREIICQIRLTDLRLNSLSLVGNMEDSFIGLFIFLLASAVSCGLLIKYMLWQILMVWTKERWFVYICLLLIYYIFRISGNLYFMLHKL